MSRWAYRLALLLLRKPIQLLFRLQPENAEVVPRSGAALLVANHVTLFDPIWVYDVLRRPVYFVATEELFRSRLVGALVRFFKAFPKRKAAQDMKTVRAMITILKKGGLVGVYPEGVRTWDGTNSPLIPTIARLIRRLRVPVYTCRLDGGYLTLPRWTGKWRRLPVRLVFNRLYGVEEIPDSEEKILEDIAREIRNREYELDIPELRKKLKGLAVGVQRVLYRCPSCHTVESLEPVRPVTTNQVECRSCYALWRMDISSRLTPVDEYGKARGPIRTLAEMYRDIKALPLLPISSHLIHLPADEELYLVSRPHFLHRERRFPGLRFYGFGRAFLTDRRLLFRGRLKGRGRVRLDAPIEEIDSLSVDPGDKLHFTFRGHLYIIRFHRESPLKWYDYLEQFGSRRGRAKGRRT
jgi:1-acyl-sn-glycerol-3-phosphate acyltransferase